MSKFVFRHAEEYLENNFNVLILGLHGTGKTESVLKLANEKGLRMKYYSCSTLDPFTDLVGVPTPRFYCSSCTTFYKEASEYLHCPKCDIPMQESLKMVRPRDLDEAEFIFFDEFNRADAKTLNAIFEIIQFGSINGEPLPNLRCCWAAMNPPGMDYQVEDLDPALVDRFDVFVPVEPQPSIPYMIEAGLPKPIAQALKAWWDDHNKEKNEHYVSPRRLMKIGMVYMKTGVLRESLPEWGTYEIAKLKDLLQKAEGQISGANNTIASAAEEGFRYNPTEMLEQKDKLVTHLLNNQDQLETHRKVLKGLEQVMPKRLVISFGEILNAILPSQLEAFTQEMPSNKRKRLIEEFKQYSSQLPEEQQLTNLKNVIDALQIGD